MNYDAKCVVICGSIENKGQVLYWLSISYNIT